MKEMNKPRLVFSVSLDTEVNDPNAYILWVSGDTYKIRDHLKRLGFQWENKDKIWFIKVLASNYKDLLEKLLEIADVHRYVYGKAYRVYKDGDGKIVLEDCKESFKVFIEELKEKIEGIKDKYVGKEYDAYDQNEIYENFGLLCKKLHKIVEETAVKYDISFEVLDGEDYEERVNAALKLWSYYMSFSTPYGDFEIKISGKMFIPREGEYWREKIEDIEVVRDDEDEE